MLQELTYILVWFFVLGTGDSIDLTADGRRLKRRVLEVEVERLVV